MMLEILVTLHFYQSNIYIKNVSQTKVIKIEQ